MIDQEELQEKIEEQEAELETIEDEITELLNRVQMLTLERQQSSEALEKKQAKRTKIEKILTKLKKQKVGGDE